MNELETQISAIDPVFRHVDLSKPGTYVCRVTKILSAASMQLLAQQLNFALCKDFPDSKIIVLPDFVEFPVGPAHIAVDMAAEGSPDVVDNTILQPGRG